VLGSSPERLDAEKPLLNLGIDSLMAVELRNWIEKELHINVPIMELMRSPSLSSLTDLLRRLTANTESMTAPTQPADEPQDTEDLLTKIEDMSDEDIDALLTALLDEQSRNRRTIP
jgi:acyl carrier protein